MVKASAALVVTILIAAAIYQVALAAGALPPEPVLAKQRQGRIVLSGPYRLASAMAGVAMVVAAVVVAAGAGLIPRGDLGERSLRWGTFIVGAYLAVNALTDLASTDAVKRWLAGGAKAVAAVLCAVVAVATQPL